MTATAMDWNVPVYDDEADGAPTTLRATSPADIDDFGTVDPIPDQPPEEFEMPRGQHASQTQRGQHAPEEPRKQQGRWSRGVNRCLTFLAWLLTSALSAGGMWNFMYDTLHLRTDWQRYSGFAIFEILMLTSGLRARARRLRSNDAPRWTIDSIAVWVFATASGMFSASDTDSTWGAAARLLISLSAAYALERLIAEEREAKFNRRRKPRWLQKLFVRMGWHDPQNKTLVEIDEARRIARLASLAFEATITTDPKAKAAAVLRYQRTLAKTNERIGLADDPDKVARLRASVALLIHGTERVAAGRVASADPWAASERADRTATRRPDGDQTVRQTGGPDNTGQDRTTKRTVRQTADRTSGQTGPDENRTTDRTANQTSTGPSTRPDQTNGHGRTAVEDARLLRQRWPHGLPDGANALVRRPEADGGFGWGGTKAGNAVRAYLDGADRTPSGLNGHNGADHGPVPVRTGGA